jgi:arylsulfatase A-like enzyme
MDNEQVWRELIARYWGMISLVDKQIGRILGVLEENGLEEETVVVFTSDHGDMMGDFHMLTKGMMFQSAVRVPLIIKAAGASRPRGVFNEPVSTVDLVPTLLDMLGRQTDRPLDGKSLYPAMKGERSLKDNEVIIEWNIRRGEDEGGCIRTIVTPDGWKMALSEVGEHELYHLAEDPRESTNLYFKGGHDAKIAELKAKIADWQVCTGDQAAVLG